MPPQCEVVDVERQWATESRTLFPFPSPTTMTKAANNMMSRAMSTPTTRPMVRPTSKCQIVTLMGQIDLIIFNYVHVINI